MHASRWRPRSGAHLPAVDACAAAVVVAGYAALADGSASDGLPHFTGPSWLGWLIAVGVGGPVAVRRFWPLPALAAVLTASTAATLCDITRDPYLSTALVVYAVALLAPPGRTAAILAAALGVPAASVLVGEAVLTPSGPWPEAAGTAAFASLVVGAGWVSGRATQEHRGRAIRRERHRAEQALTDERLRIARELHDIVSHSLSVIVVKAAVAGHVTDRRPEEARDALRVIEETGREALTEMRRALGVLRGPNAGARAAGSGPAGSGPAGTNPPPGLEDLPALVRHAEEAGVHTELRTRLAADLSVGTALTVHRIVQEALTNVVRHVGEGASCRVNVTTGPSGDVRITVVDDGSGSPSPLTRTELTGGHGIVGMRERVALYGGTLTAGPRPGGGFAVTALLPSAAAGSAHGPGEADG